MSGELINTDGLSNALIVLADKIGMTIQQMYLIYVGAQQTIGIVQIVMTLLYLIGIVAIIVVAYILYSRTKTGSYEGNTWILILVGAIAVTIIFTVTMLQMYSAIIAVMCPQYSALQAMMSDIGHIIYK